MVDRDWQAGQAANWQEAHSLAAAQVAVLEVELQKAETARDLNAQEIIALRSELERAWRQIDLHKSRLNEIEGWRGFGLLARMNRSLHQE